MPRFELSTVPIVVSNIHRTDSLSCPENHPHFLGNCFSGQCPCSKCGPVSHSLMGTPWWEGTSTRFVRLDVNHAY